MLMIVISLLAAASGVASAVLPLVQLKVLLRHKHGKAFSLSYLAQGVASNGIWLAYGLMIHDLVLDFSCAGGFVTGLLLYLAAIKYRNHHPHRTIDAIVAPLAHDPVRLAALAAAIEIELVRHAQLAEQPTLIIRPELRPSGELLPA